jgi:hypothetical protein
MRPLVPIERLSKYEAEELQPAYQRIKFAFEWQRASNQVECQSQERRTAAREAAGKKQEKKS